MHVNAHMTARIQINTHLHTNVRTNKHTRIHTYTTYIHRNNQTHKCNGTRHLARLKNKNDVHTHKHNTLSLCVVLDVITCGYIDACMYTHTSTRRVSNTNNDVFTRTPHTQTRTPEVPESTLNSFKGFLSIP